MSGDASDGQSRGNSGQGNGKGGQSQSDEISTAELAVMVASALFTLALFAFAAWQALTGPAAATPQATVVDTNTTASGEVIATVELRNRGDTGLISVTVEVPCTTPPAELTFANVPAGGRRRGSVACPPGTSDPNASVATWIQE